MIIVFKLTGYFKKFSKFTHPLGFLASFLCSALAKPVTIYALAPPLGGKSATQNDLIHCGTKD